LKSQEKIRIMIRMTFDWGGPGPVQTPETKLRNSFVSRGLIREGMSSSKVSRRLRVSKSLSLSLFQEKNYKLSTLTPQRLPFQKW
jgi:hypothetical protein